MELPDEGTVWKADQEASGVGAFPIRTFNCKLVPAGRIESQLAEDHVTGAPAFITLDVNVAE